MLFIMELSPILQLFHTLVRYNSVSAVLSQKLHETDVETNGNHNFKIDEVYKMLSVAGRCIENNVIRPYILVQDSEML